MAETHYREGKKPLLLYSIVKSPELANPVDSSSKATGKTCFVLTEVYESPAGVENHWKQGAESWNDFPALVAWPGRCKVTTLHGAPVWTRALRLTPGNGRYVVTSDGRVINCLPFVCGGFGCLERC